MISSLLYLTCTRPDIMHAIGIIGRFQSNPKGSHLQAINIIFKYIQGTPDFGIWYPKDADITLHHTQMQIGPEILMTGKALVEVHFTWGPD